ncbi:MAG TPA: cupin domain-containing protein [Acidobacteriaceae bacterium]|nr:cupin domain-containing protein [Acidobacteriaceae bacterium]
MIAGISKRDIFIALIAVVCTLAATAAVHTNAVIGETIYDWNTLTPHKTETGEVRTVVEGPTATLDRLEMHVTTLNPGKSPHAPHKHPNEELIILDKGTVEVLVNGAWKRVGPGSIIFNASNVLHGLRNVGDTPAQYHVINFKTDKTPNE